MKSLDRTFCASPNCTNKCGRKMTEQELTLAKTLKIPISYAYFCGEQTIKGKTK